jgi:hypothetical protein
MANFTYVKGNGDEKWLRLIDESFGMLRSSPLFPNLRMLYKSSTDMLSEGFIWGDGWWIQNSFGFTMGAVPLLDPFWSRILQNSYDAFWKRIGDGKRIGADSGVTDNRNLSFRAPDGSLGDCVFRDGIIYRQGDGDVDSYDWFYEATAAGVLMQAEILLFDRRPEEIRKYLPLMRRSLDHIESTRAENGLFLVGTASNLLAPSYGGSFDPETGKVGKGYLTGLAVTASAALKKCAELSKMAGNKADAAEYEARLKRTLDALPLLLTEEGYFVKSMDPDGTKHGVYGAERYGYLEGVCNADAAAWEVVGEDIARSIHAKIASVPGIRPAGVLCNNYPHLDDTLESYRKRTSGPHSLGWRSGDWVDGGCWATVEGRAILAYMKLGAYDDAFRAAELYMRWAEEYRQDAPLSQWGRNTNNPWQRENDDHTVCERPVAVMIDNFAPVTCLLRALFDLSADAEGLTVRLRIPEGITEYAQREPAYFGGCRLCLRTAEGDGGADAAPDGTLLEADGSGRFRIPSDLLPRGGAVCLSVSRDGTAVLSPVRDPEVQHPVLTGEIEGVPEDLAGIYAECRERLHAADDPMLAAQLGEILSSVETAALRRKLPFDRHDLRPMTDEKRAQILNLYDQTARELYEGLKWRK